MVSAATAVLSDLEKRAYDWLTDRGSTLWAHHEIASEDGRIKAARWFAGEINQFNQHSWLAGWGPDTPAQIQPEQRRQGAGRYDVV